MRELELIAVLDLRMVAAQRRHVGPTGHYNRPDFFRPHVDTTTPRTPVGRDHRGWGVGSR